jgi:NADH-quinone oxidoreductase subunit I
MAATVVNVRRAREEMSVAEQIYLPEVVRGLGITMRHFFANVFGKKYTVTLNYPEEKLPYPERFRGHHRLTVRDDGQVRCVACMCCSTACPTNCITIDAGEHTDARIEKYPTRFDIDLLRCIYCGFCVEACPCDAIRMDTQAHVVPHDNREAFVANKVNLMERHGLRPSKAVQGGVKHQRVDTDSH